MSALAAGPLRQLDRVLPARYRSNAHLLRRVRTALAIAAVLPPLLGVFWMLDLPIFHGPNRALFLALYAAAVPVLFGCVGLVLIAERLRLAVNLGIGYFAAFLTLLVCLTGGPLSGSAIWLIAVPFAAALALGRGAALGWLGIVSFVLVGVYALHVHGPPFEAYARGDLIRVWHFNMLGLLGLVLAMAMACERARARASETLAVAHVELARARDRADTANRAKGTFVAAMSHELRTPMNAVLGFTELAREQHGSLRDDLDDASALSTIERSARSLLAILDDILDLSDVEAKRIEVRIVQVDLRRHIEQVVALMHRQASLKGTTLVVELDEPLPETIETDPGRLQQILVNLVGNAIKFSFEGEVRIRVEKRGGGSAERLRIEVSDSGIGMTGAQVERLFQPFAQADPSTTRLYGGTGLGLSISRKLTERLGGTIGVESTPGLGSTFHLELPLAASSAAQRSRAREHHDRPTRVPLDARVLVVDDTVDNRRLAEHVLTRAGAQVDTSPSGEDAIARAIEADRAGSSYDVILMDLQMPGMDGYAALRALRELGCTARVVAFTAHATTGERERTVAAGFFRHASKPLARDALIALVDEVARSDSRANAPASEPVVRTVRPKLQERLARALLAPELRHSSEAIREARAAVAMTTAGLAALPPLAALANWVLPRGVGGPLSVLILGLAPVMIGGLYLDRVRRSRRASSQLVCLYLVGVVAVVTTLCGGAGAPVTAWGLLAPLAALTLIGPRAGWVWGALLALMTEAFYVADRAGLVFRDHVAQDWPLVATASTVLLVAISTTFGLIYERGKAEAIEGLAAANEALEQARVQAESSQRARAEFLASISHELRTPMTAILGFAELIAERWRERKASAEDIERIETIGRNARRLLQIINDLLDLSRIDAGKLELESLAFAPERLLARASAASRERAEAQGTSFQLELQSLEGVVLRGDPTRVDQIVQKLCDNAVKFTERGRVVLRARIHERDGATRLEIEIEDAARGVPPDLDRLFLPFRRVDDALARSHGGTDIDLALCQRLAKAMGGGLEVESRERVGTTFHVSLPVEVECAIAGAGNPEAGSSGLQAISARPGSPTLHARLLLAEDCADNQRLIASMLRRAGAEVDVVEDGRAATERALAAASEGTPYGVAILDLEMPVMDGYEAARALRATGYAGAILALTAHSASERRRQCQAAGFDDVASKPVDWNLLVATLQRLVRAHEDSA